MIKETHRRPIKSFVFNQAHALDGAIDGAIFLWLRVPINNVKNYVPINNVKNYVPINNVKNYVPISNVKNYVRINPFPSEWVLRALIDFTLSNARRFYSSMGNLLDGKGLTISKFFHVYY